MRKKFLSSLILIFFTFVLTGCVGNSSNISKSNKKLEGTMYQKISLNDTVNNVTVFESLIPDKWNSYIESNWNIISSSIPGKENVQLSSPDGLASIKIISQEGYVENKKYAEGENKEYYTTYLHYMDAPTYLDYFINNNYSGASIIKDVGVSEDVIKQLKAYNEIKLNGAKETAAQLNGVTPSVSISVSENAVSAVKRQYEYGSNVIEASTAVSSLKTNLNSSISQLLSSESIEWIIPYTIVFQAENKEAFDKYYNDYLFVVANSKFTTDYYAMVEYVSSVIVNLYTSYYAAKSQAALDAMNDYIDSNYSSTSSSSTNEKVMQMWDDCINEVDEYVTTDGNSIKTSMFNETVAQNGDEFYVGSKSGIPSGFTELEKAY